MSAEAILVLNAGSSSIKFSLFTAGGGALDAFASGQVEAIHSAPHFVARDAAGELVGERRWGDGASLGHDGALAHLIDWLKATHGAGHRLAAVGHRDDRRACGHRRSRA